MLSSCGGDDGDSEEPEETEDAALDECENTDDRTWVALGLSETVVPEIEVYDEPDGNVTETIPNPWLEPKGGAGTSSPPAFQVLTENEDEDPRDAEWLHVNLPSEPTGSEGFIRSENVSVDCVHYRITVDLSDFELTFTHQGEPVQVNGEDAVFPVGLGENDYRSTKPGNYFVTELVIESDDNGNPVPDSIYGDGAYGLDAYSDDAQILEDFADSNGQAGLHGTNDPDAIPGNISNGCIRLKNEHFNELKAVVPLGTPVDVVE